jgi:DNA-binding transcriptional regulator YiaG
VVHYCSDTVPMYSDIPVPASYTSFMKPGDVLILAEVRASCDSGTARQLREGARLSRSEVGDACGVSGRAVGHWETGARSPTGAPAVEYGKLLRQLARRVT